MGCFHPNPHDLRVKSVKKPYEKSKGMYVRVDGDDIQLRGHKGGLLESIPMHMVRWLPCSLPGGIDHCISLQYKQPQTKEIFLKAKTRSAVADILNNLDAAAAGKTFPAVVEVQANTAEAEAPPPVDIPKQKDNADQGHSSARCPRCWKLAQLLDEHEAQLREIEILKAELESCRANLHAAIDQRNEAVDRAANAAELARAAAQARQAELEACLAEATDRCEKLVKELRLAAAAADNNALKCKELQNTIDTTEEEKKLLVEALTTAQAQAHDLQEAFKETSSQLQGASLSCASLKSQASGTRSELKKAQDEAIKHSEMVHSLQSELKSLQNNLEQVQQEAATSQQVWAEEKGRLEGALAAMSNIKDHSSSSISSNEHNAAGRSSVEAMVLRTQVDQLKEELNIAQAAAAEREHKERTHAAESAAKRAQNELGTTQKTLEEHYAALHEEAKSLRAEVVTAQLEAANAATALESQRSAARKLDEEVVELQERLTAALAAQSAAVKVRHGLEAAVDKSKVEIDRLVRRNKALEARCQKNENNGGKIAVSR